MLDLISLIQNVVRAELHGREALEFGIVETVHVPDAAGRSQYACDVRLPGTDAIYQAVPLTTSYLGHVAPPVEGDMVVLGFIAADPDQPVIIGLVFSDNVHAPPVAEGEMLTRLPHDAADDARIDTHLTAGQNGDRNWQVSLPSGPNLQMTDNSVVATLEDRTMRIDGAAGEVSLSSGGGTITMTDTGDITISADGALTLDVATDLTLKAGGAVTLEAGTTADMKAGATMDIAAALINLN